jgi:hypothetical protein
MAASKRNKIRLKSEAGALIKKLRKPMAPPTRVDSDESKYSRPRERELIRKVIKK